MTSLIDPDPITSRHAPPWNGIKPGDFGWDEGGGIVGWLITLGTKAPYAHCWVYHEEIEPGVWKTAEAYPPRIKWRTRTDSHVHRVMRVWQTPEQQEAILKRSESMVGTKYAYRELLRIVLYRLRQVRWRLFVIGLIAALLSIPIIWWRPIAFEATALFLLSFLPVSPEDNPNDAICSNHVAQCALAADPNIWLLYPPNAIWPGRVERDLALYVWNLRVTAEDESPDPPAPLDAEGDQSHPAHPAADPH